MKQTCDTEETNNEAMKTMKLTQLHNGRKLLHSKYRIGAIVSCEEPAASGQTFMYSL